MSKIKRLPGTIWTRWARLPAALMVCLCSAVSAFPQIEGLDKDQMSVRELMQLDTELALKLARDRSSGTNRSATERSSLTVRNMSGEPRLAAIYGVGQQLMAEVVLADVIYLYRRGQALPVGVAPGNEVYLLHKITASCIDIGNADASHHLCLRPEQWVGK